MPVQHHYSSRLLPLGVLGAMLLLPALSHPAAAQDATPLPAQIRAGTCDAPGDVLHELTAVGSAPAAQSTPTPAVERLGSEAAVPLQLSMTTLDATMTELTKAESILVIYTQADAPDSAIACGALGGLIGMQMTGMIMPGDELAIGLGEVNDSGRSGLALIKAAGLQTTIRLYLIGAPPA